MKIACCTINENIFYTKKSMKNRLTFRFEQKKMKINEMNDFGVGQYMEECYIFYAICNKKNLQNNADNKNEIIALSHYLSHLFIMKESNIYSCLRFDTH